MVAHKAAFDAGEVERLVILVVVILGAEVFIPVTGHILLEESHKVLDSTPPLDLNCTPKVRHKTFGVQYRGT